MVAVNDYLFSLGLGPRVGFWGRSDCRVSVLLQVGNLQWIFLHHRDF